MRPSIMAIFFTALFASAALALMKLAGVIDWCWLAVSAPLLVFYVLFGAAMYGFSCQHDKSKSRNRKR